MPGVFFDDMNKVQKIQNGKTIKDTFKDYHDARKKKIKDPDKNNRPAYE